MKARPIIFNGPMVRAILNGRKTQTRRIVKPQPLCGICPCCYTKTGWAEVLSEGACQCTTAPVRCPYGTIGDRLWVRETFADLRGIGFGDEFAYREKSLKDYNDGRGLVEDGDSERCRFDYGVKWTPSIHMPRCASRITLEITNVRVERLQDISEEDAVAEGVTIPRQFLGFDSDNQGIENHNGDMAPSDVFRELWQSINGPDSWAANPWVWAVEFERVPNDH